MTLFLQVVITMTSHK